MTFSNQARAGGRRDLTPRRPSAAQRGVSLLELMIGLALGLLVIGVITSFFGPASDHRRNLENTSQMFDNATYAAELLAEEIRAAGYFSELQTAAVTWQAADPCAVTPAALGWSSSPATAPLPLVGIGAAEATPGCVSDRLAGTAMLTLRRADFTATPVASLPAGVFLQVSTCGTDPANKQFVVDGSAASMDLRRRNCTTVAPARRVLVRTYFIECGGGCGAGAVPRLTRAELTPAGTIALTPLVDGIENIQFEYGFDTDNDGLPDLYRTGLSGVAGNADNDWSNVVAVRLYVIARSRNTTIGHVDTTTFDIGLNGTVAAANDGFKRHIHTTLVRLMNVGGPRELP
jgi:type IV pilus assembly protein PilW